MASPIPAAPDEEKISESKVSELIEEFESEAQTRDLKGLWRLIAGVIGVLVSLYALFWTQYSVTTQVYRASFLMLVLSLSFIAYPMFKRDRKAVTVIDLLLVAASVASMVFLILNYESALQRVVNPTTLELVMGALAILCCLEAARRTTGSSLPIITVVFFLYALFGNWIPGYFGHRGYGYSRIIGANYLTLEGMFGVPLDVAATFIVLFTIYGAVLEYSGAGKFFLDWAFAALGKSNSGSGPGRTVTAAGFLLGTVSGSGVATTVTLGALAWPMLKKAGYNKETAGGILSAAGIGATLSPPTLGAAAFIIAEYLGISYLSVLIMAAIPTVLYYLSCFFMIEADSRRMGTKAVAAQSESLLQITIKYGYHFTSLLAVAVLMATGMSAFLAVFWSIVLAYLLSFIRPETRLHSLRGLAIGAVVAALLWFGRDIANLVLDPLNLEVRTLSQPAFWGMMTGVLVSLIDSIVAKRGGKNGVLGPILKAFESGGKGTVSIAATTAVAGLIVSIITLTGLGTRLSGGIVALAGNNIVLTIVFAAIAIWVLGLAVPVTASYIIGAVMIVPALVRVGVPAPAAHMFLFYYAVLADVTPPTALAPAAAAALTGGRPYPTMLMAWKYCLPAFLVPFMFTIAPEGSGILLLDATSYANALANNDFKTLEKVLLAINYDGNSGWQIVQSGTLWLTILQTLITGCLGVWAFSIALGGWLKRHANIVERVMAGVAGILLLASSATTDVIGIALLVAAVILHLVRARAQQPTMA